MTRERVRSGPSFVGRGTAAARWVLEWASLARVSRASVSRSCPVAAEAARIGAVVVIPSSD